MDAREANENCSVFVLGIRYLDRAYLMVLNSGRYEYVPVEERAAGDIIFYGDVFNQVSHVAYVGNGGKIISKFYGDVRVYEHDLWDEDIFPPSITFDRALVFRRVR